MFDMAIACHLKGLASANGMIGRSSAWALIRCRSNPFTRLVMSDGVCGAQNSGLATEHAKTDSIADITSQ